jgi:TPP-dependent pyruvate/acetoin dehydrogenase alpha subunit
LPVLFLCENNLYAMGTRIERALSRLDIAERARTYGIEAAAVDGMDVLAVEEAARAAATFVKETNRPYFLECRTYRFRAHSMFDAELYRDKAEVDEWRKRDPIALLSGTLEAAGALDPATLGVIERGVKQEIERAVAFAEAGTWEPIGRLTTDVYTSEVRLRPDTTMREVASGRS